MVGLVHYHAGTWQSKRLLRDDVLDCLYGKAAASAKALIDQGLGACAAVANAAGLEALDRAVFGLNPGPLRTTEARSAADLYRTAALLYSSLAQLDNLDEMDDADAPSPEEITRRFGTEVREAVVKRVPELARFFGKGGPLVDGGQHVRFGYFSPKAVMHFLVLHPVRQSESVKDAHAKLFELFRAREISGIANAALISYVPRDDDPMLGPRQRQQLQINRAGILGEATAVGVRLCDVTSAVEGCERLIELSA